VPTPSGAEAVLVTGVYGSGKSTVVADIGGLLEERGEYYGVLDIDWLGRFDAGATRSAPASGAGECGASAGPIW
jgi:putative protein kinase ArgK-like GTPase of G3E family